MSSVFSGELTDLSRVGGWGVFVMVTGILLCIVGPRVKPAHALPLRLIGLAVTAVGALGAMKII